MKLKLVKIVTQRGYDHKYNKSDVKYRRTFYKKKYYEK